jgi:hypothetical protein
MRSHEIIDLKYVQEEPGTLGADGYWYAGAVDGGYDATGATPLEAVVKLASVLARKVREANNERT